MYNQLKLQTLMKVDLYLRTLREMFYSPRSRTLSKTESSTLKKRIYIYEILYICI